MPVKMIYPRNNTKVSNPDITFRWKRVSGKKTYILEIFGSKYVKNPLWEKISTSRVTGNTYRRYLKPGYLYRCTVTTAGENPENIMRAPDIQSRMAGRPGFPVSPNDLPQFIAQQDSSSITFYVKKRANYLKKYLTIKGERLKTDEHLGPTIPLLFYLLDRYSRWVKATGSIARIPLDEEFARAMDDLDPKLRTSDKLDTLRSAYNNPGLKDLKEKVFGRDYAEIPNDDNAVAWTDNALNVLFSNTWLKEIKDNKNNKKLDLHFKYAKTFDATDVQLNEDLRIPIPSTIVGTAPEFLKEDKIYALKVILDNNGSIEYLLELEKNADEYYLYGPGADLRSLDAAPYKAELWERDPFNPRAEGTLWGPEGKLEIKGGKPVILGVDPNSVLDTYSQGINVRIRDGGRRDTIILTPVNQSPAVVPITNGNLVRTDQTFGYQVFGFKLNACSGPVPENTYDLTYRNYQGTHSVNSVSFAVNCFEYEVLMKELRCIDESNPEWWGDDSISFQAFINTGKFLQNPFQSKIYYGFHDDTGKTSFSLNDGHLYFRPNDFLIPSGRRIIEDFLSINIALYEHDNLEWLEFLANALISFAQSFLAHMIDAFTLGLGGFIIEAGLEVSGLNDMREEAVDSMVSSWEIELLHQDQAVLSLRQNGTYNLPSLDMKTSESEYKITFEVQRQ